MYKVLPFIILIFLSSDLLGQSSDFEKLVSLFKTNRMEIPRRLAIKFFEHQTSKQSSELLTNGIVIRTSDFIALSTYTSCGAGGICESSGLTSFDFDGNRIDTIPFENALGDCSFSNNRSIQFKSDTLLIFEINKVTNDCELDRPVSIEVSSEYISINSNGKFENTASKMVNGNREYYMVSSQLLSEGFLKQFNKEQLATMRNEIFAAYGYRFRSKRWKKYFKSKSWYKGKSDKQEKYLSLLERLNLELIKKLESR